MTIYDIMKKEHVEPMSLYKSGGGYGTISIKEF
jgi:hypothetical protein